MYPNSKIIDLELFVGESSDIYVFNPANTDANWQATCTLFDKRTRLIKATIPVTKNLDGTF